MYLLLRNCEDVLQEVKKATMQILETLEIIWYTGHALPVFIQRGEEQHSFRSYWHTPTPNYIHNVEIFADTSFYSTTRTFIHTCYKMKIAANCIL